LAGGAAATAKSGAVECNCIIKTSMPKKYQERAIEAAIEESKK
jgi:tRNA A-37 threonylcarbamoyl transferase component Bud32